MRREMDAHASQKPDTQQGLKIKVKENVAYEDTQGQLIKVEENVAHELARLMITVTVD